MYPALIAAALAVTATPDFQSILGRLQVTQDVPGVSAVVGHRNEILFAGGSGVADIETTRAMTADTVLYAGSLSKVFTAVLTLRLVEENKIALADPVDGIGSAAVGSRPDITVAHLLTHASGLEREGNFGYWFSADFPDATALATYLLNAELRTAPGTSLHYSNVGYASLGLVIERVTGRAYGDALRTGILEPLGMQSSGAPGPPANIATGYTPIGRVIPNEQRPFAGVGREVGNRNIREYHDARAMSPAFGVYTSAQDLGRLARFLLGDGGDDVLSQDMRKRMLTRQESGWGLGIKIGRLDGRPVARHEGWFAAHRSHLLLDVDGSISVVVLTNSDSASPADIAEALYDSVLPIEIEKRPID